MRNSTILGSLMIDSQYREIHQLFSTIRNTAQNDPLAWMRSEVMGKVALAILKILIDHITWHRERGDK